MKGVGVGQTDRDHVAYGSVIIVPGDLAHTLSHFTSVVGSYIGIHWMYVPGVLVTIVPVSVVNTLMYGAINEPGVLGVTLV